MLDMRNHGSSPHTSQMGYDLMVQDIKQYIRKHNLERVSLIAHSMVTFLDINDAYFIGRESCYANGSGISRFDR